MEYEGENGIKYKFFLIPLKLSYSIVWFGGFEFFVVVVVFRVFVGFGFFFRKYVHYKLLSMYLQKSRWIIQGNRIPYAL